MKRFIPNFYCSNIFQLSNSFFIENKIKCVLSDLDNTLDVYNELNPSQRVIELKERLEKIGIELCIVSNNKAKRKEIYAKRLGVKSIFSAHKPGGKRISKFIAELGYEKADVLLVGDQLLTDVLCGKNAGIKVCLTDPISHLDQWTTHFNRLIDRPLRKHLIKKGYLEKVMVKDYGK